MDEAGVGDGLVRHVAANAPGRLPELRQVLAVDERALAAVEARTAGEPGSYPG